MEASRAVGLGLVSLGALFVVVVFAISITYLNQYSSIDVGGSSLEEALSGSADVLLEVLIKVAFLGVGLAAGSVLLSKGIALLRPPKRGEGGG